MEYKLVVEKRGQRNYTAFVMIAGLPAVSVEGRTRVEAISKALNTIINQLVKKAG